MCGRRAGAGFSMLRSLAVANVSFAAAITVIPKHVQAENLVTIGGPWTLVAHDGETVTDRTYLGKWLLVFFGYTSCPDTCPMTLHEVAVALDRLGPEAEQVRPLFITVDPQRDTPEIVGQYTNSFDSRISGLSGSAEQLSAVTKVFGVYYTARKYGAGAEEPLIDHSTYLYVMDPQGRFVRGFDADTPGDRIAVTLHELIGHDRARASERDR